MAAPPIQCVVAPAFGPSAKQASIKARPGLPASSAQVGTGRAPLAEAVALATGALAGPGEGARGKLQRR
eukprot:4358641-Alexandrium_andersonii.AAC.1